MLYLICLAILFAVGGTHGECARGQQDKLRTAVGLRNVSVSSRSGEAVDNVAGGTDVRAVQLHSFP